MKLLMVFVATIVACQSSAILEAGNADSDRNGNLNIYFLYTRTNRNEPERLRLSAGSLTGSSLNPSRSTAVLVHGHGEGPFSSLNPMVKDAFLDSEDINVIVVDWEVFAGMSYSNAVNSVPSIGQGLAVFIELLVAERQATFDRLHLVGFDLGAHVIGFAGRLLNGQVARITGLDPAASGWGSRSGRLNTGDARYVEVIHTDGDGLTANGIGTAIGHVDFFVNGGGNQPGCVFHSCSHNRAWEVFAATLRYNHLIGSRCSNSLQISLNSCNGPQLHLGNNDFVKFGSGSYRVNTRRRYPF